MKRKLTLTVDNGITHRAKTHARKKGKSLSQLIEDLLQKEIGGNDSIPLVKSFSNRWFGKFELSEKTDERTLHLKKKYGLTEKD